MNLFGVAQTVLPVILMLLLGVVCRVRNWIDKRGVDGLQALVMKITLPAVLFGAFYTAEYSLDVVLIAVSMFALCGAAMALGGGARKLLGGSRYLPFLTAGFEAGMMGYALYALLYGGANMSQFAILDLGQVLFVFTVYMTLLSRLEGRGGSARDAVRSMIASPTIWAIVAGVAVGASGLGAAIDATPWGAVLAEAVGFLSQPTGAVILVVVGYGLDFGRVPWRATLTTVLARLVVVAILGGAFLLLIGRFTTLTEPLVAAAALMFTLPPPYVLPIMASDEAEGAYMSSTLSVYTLLSVACFAILSIFVRIS